MTLVKKTNGFYPTLHSVFDDFWGNNWMLPVKEKAENTIPAVNVQESDNEFKIDVAAPGYAKNDFSVTLENEILTISVEKKNENTEENDNYKRKEFSYSSFIRKFNVPNELVDTERVEANYENGILHLVIPKREEIKPKPARLIEIH